MASNLLAMASHSENKIKEIPLEYRINIPLLADRGTRQMWPGAERDNVNGFISVATSDLLSKTLFKTQGAPLFLLVKFDRESVKERRPFFFFPKELHLA